VSATAFTRRRFVASGLALAPWIGPRAAGERPRRVVIAHAFEATEEQKESHARWFKAEGWILGGNLALEYVPLQAIEDPEAAERRAREIVASKPDAIIVESDHQVLFRKLTRDIPLVFANLWFDPVRLGLVEAYNRPGGNMTGTAIPPIDRAWQTAIELRPGMKRIGVLYEDTLKDPYRREMRITLGETASRLRLEMVEIAVRPSAPWADVERRIRSAKVDAIDVGISDAVGWKRELMRFLERSRIIGVWGDAYDVRDGGLFAVNSDGRRGFYEAVRMTGRILHGASPSQMPVQFVRSIHTSINLDTARAMDIEVPASVLAAADLVYP